MRKYLLLVGFVLILPLVSFGQNVKQPSLTNKLEHWNLDPVLAFQIWNTYTMGAQIYNENLGQYQKVDNRFNTQLRRSRLGIKGQPYQQIKFNFTAALDLVGKDLLSGTEGGGNNGASPRFRTWNAYLQWKLLPKQDYFHLTIGYLPPQIGRESITPAFRVSSMEKSWSQNYLRRHLVGTGPGRAVGVNIGGRIDELWNHISFQYDVGIFSPQFQAYSGNSQGQQASPLLVGRYSIDIGAPESKSYTTSHKSNYFGQRNGLSLAVAGAMQNSTDLFQNNYALGADFLFNLGQFNLDGEWTQLWRTAYSDQRVTANTGYLRATYNIRIKNKYWFEPHIMWVQFSGATETEELETANLVKSLAGKDTSFNIGANFYFNPDLKLSLSYTNRQADAGTIENGATVNNYFFQSSVGAIKRGDWLGLGLVFIL